MSSDYFEVEDPLEGSLRLFRPELAIKHNDGDLDEDYILCTWKNPVKCSECGSYILTYDYYYYEKRNIDKNQTLLKQYWCCVDCFDSLAATERLKVPANKVVKKILPEKHRKTHYLNLATDQDLDEYPAKKIPLNADCHPKFPEFSRS